MKSYTYFLLVAFAVCNVTYAKTIKNTASSDIAETYNPFNGKSVQEEKRGEVLEDLKFRAAVAKGQLDLQQIEDQLKASKNKPVPANPNQGIKRQKKHVPPYVPKVIVPEPMPTVSAIGILRGKENIGLVSYAGERYYVKKGTRIGGMVIMDIGESSITTDRTTLYPYDMATAPGVVLTEKTIEERKTEQAAKQQTATSAVLPNVQPIVPGSPFAKEVPPKLSKELMDKLRPPKPTSN